MRNWRVRTRAQHKARFHAWKNSDSDHSSWEAPWSPIWRSQYTRRWKRDIKHVKEGLAKFAEFPYYEDCRYHVCRQTNIEADHNYGRIDIEGESLINGTPSNCSYEHCGIVHLTKEDGEERAAFVKAMGMMPYQLKYVYGIPEDREKLMQSLRYSLGLERVWNFNENGGTQEITDEGKAWLLGETDITYDDLKPMEQEEMQKALAES